MEIRIVCKNHAKNTLHNSESSRTRQNNMRCKNHAKKCLHNSEIELLTKLAAGRNVSEKKFFFL